MFTILCRIETVARLVSRNQKTQFQVFAYSLELIVRTIRALKSIYCNAPAKHQQLICSCPMQPLSKKQVQVSLFLTWTIYLVQSSGLLIILTKLESFLKSFAFYYREDSKFFHNKSLERELQQIILKLSTRCLGIHYFSSFLFSQKIGLVITLKTHVQLVHNYSCVFYQTGQ